THVTTNATDVAEAAQRFGARGLTCQAIRDQGLDGGFDVIAKLVVEIGRWVGARESEIAAPLGLARFGHVASGTGSRDGPSSTRLTAATGGSQPCVRWRSSRRPSGA